MEVEGALTAQPTHQAGVTTLRVSQGGRLLMQGFSNGMMRVSEAGLDSTDLTGKPAACQMSLYNRHTQCLWAIWEDCINRMKTTAQCYEVNLPS